MQACSRLFVHSIPYTSRLSMFVYTFYHNYCEPHQFAFSLVNCLYLAIYSHCICAEIACHFVCVCVFKSLYIPHTAVHL